MSSVDVPFELGCGTTMYNGIFTFDCLRPDNIDLIGTYTPGKEITYIEGLFVCDSGTGFYIVKTDWRSGDSTHLFCGPDLVAPLAIGNVHACSQISLDGRKIVTIKNSVARIFDVDEGEWVNWAILDQAANAYCFGYDQVCAWNKAAIWWTGGQSLSRKGTFTVDYMPQMNCLMVCYSTNVCPIDNFGVELISVADGASVWTRNRRDNNVLLMRIHQDSERFVTTSLSGTRLVCRVDTGETEYAFESQLEYLPWCIPNTNYLLVSESMHGFGMYSLPSRWTIGTHHRFSQTVRYAIRAFFRFVTQGSICDDTAGVVMEFIERL